MNTKLTTKAKSDLEENFLKLIVNSVFGKTMENVKKLFSVRTRLSHNKMAFKIFISNRNKKKKSKNE